jgi:hypothetical protein
MNNIKENDRPWYKNIQNLGIIISLVIAIISLVISGILASNELKPFELNVYANGVYIVPNSGSDDILNLIVPIGFVNAGNKAGVVDEVYLIVNYQGTDTKYDPMEELDLSDFLKSRQLNINYVTMTPYSPFLLEGYKEKSKAILFFSDMSRPAGMKILPGNYTINIYVKTQNDNKAVNKKTIRIYINNDTIIKHQKEYISYFLDNNRLIFQMAPPKES